MAKDKKIHELELMKKIHDFLGELDTFGEKMRVLAWLQEYLRDEHMKFASLAGGAIGSVFARETGEQRTAPETPIAKK